MGRGSNKGLVDFLSMQLWLLLFADDIVLLATTWDMMSTLFTYVCEFCVGNELVINASKTELMVCGVDAPKYNSRPTVQLGDYVIKVATTFRYLGVHFD